MLFPDVKKVKIQDVQIHLEAQLVIILESAYVPHLQGIYADNSHLTTTTPSASLSERHLTKAHD